VSTRNSQTPKNQIQALCEVASRKGWQIVDQYVDHGVSGAKGRDKRPEFDRLLKDATRRKFDVLLAWPVDRLGRSLQDLVSFLGEIHASGVDLYLHVQGVDTTTPAGRALFQMLGVFAEFERSIIQERIHAGLARARSKGVRLGRPPAVERLAERDVRQRTSELGPAAPGIADGHALWCACSTGRSRGSTAATPTASATVAASISFLPLGSALLGSVTR
jgi:DNA invertase Pin-like site-specific DNA recombinase